MAWTVSSVRVRAPRIALFLALIAGSLASFPSPLSAQTVSPRIVEFDPSPDHNASVSGVAVVREYELRFFAVGSTQRLHVIELGKPNVQSDGRIRYAGITHYTVGAHSEIESVLRAERFDFAQFNYSIGTRASEHPSTAA